MMIQHDLTGQWQMREMLMGTWMPVNIPGSVISALLENGKIDDPYYRTNEYEVREMMRKDYVFEKTFDVDEKILAMNDIELVCDGLDTIAEIYLNGQCIGKADNMHRTWRFDCRGILEAKNILQIIFRSPIEYVENYKETEGNEITNIAAGAMKGNQYIRKAHSMFGWDWGAQLPDMGIWRNIRIEAFDRMRLTEPLIEQQHSPEGVTLKVRAQLAMSVALTQDWGVDVYDGNSEDLSKMPAMTDRNMTISVFDPDGTKIGMTVSPACSEAAVFEIREPKLWWTNGLGAHPLYKVRIELADKNAVLQEVKEYRIGLRTLTVSQDKDQWGSEFAFKINGVKIFTKGADYIPEDCIYSHITKERLEMLVDTSVRSNFNCLRVWGGGYYPSDEFYDLCDENGLIVWQDLMYACNVYDFNDDFERNIIAETKDNVRRLRHHACLGMWCGNNEIESAWHHWSSFQGHSEKLRADYIKQFEYCLPKTVKKYDSQTFYWPSSPSSGGCFDDPDDENRGDTHYWDVWHGQKPFSDYHNHYFRFCSEFGFQSFPSIKTVRTYTEADDRNIFSEVMESHQKNDAANGKMLYYLSENFQYPKDFESLLYVTQVLQGIAVKYGVEHWRRNRGRCMGALYWQLNDNWPVASWASIDYFGRWKALQYMACHFFAQKLGTIYEENGRIYIAAVNDDLEDTTVHVRLSLKDMELNVCDTLEFTEEAAACSAVKLMDRDYSELIADGKSKYFVEAVFTFGDGTVMTQTDIFVPYKHLALKKPHIKTEVSETNDGFKISLTTDTYTPFAALDLTEADAIFSDNYFCMGSPRKEIEVKYSDIRSDQEMTLENFKKQLTITHLYDTIR